MISPIYKTVSWYANITVVTRDSTSMQEGDTLVINCTLTQHYPGPLTASHIFFTFDKSGPSRLPADMVFVVDESTAQLRQPNTTKDQKGFYSCWLDQSTINKNNSMMGYVDFKGCK